MNGLRGHPLYEGVRRVTKKQGEGDLAKGANLWIPVQKSLIGCRFSATGSEDGNGDSIDEQLIVVKVEKRTGNISLKPASLFLDIVPSNNRDPVPRLPRDVAMLTTETVGMALEEICEKQSMERSEKAAKVKSHVQTSLNALIRKENIKFEKFERDSDKHKCIERVFDFEQRLDRRETLDRQGEWLLLKIPIALAFVEPMEIDDQNLPEGRTMPKQNKKVEMAAVDYVRDIELAKPEVYEVKSREADGAGYDLETWDEHVNILRFIEVKGKTTEHDVIITPNEWSVAERLRDDYWLYVVSKPLSEPELLVIQDPWAKLNAQTETKIMRHFLDMGQVRNVVNSELRGEK